MMLVIGIGNDDRGDDGAGLAAARAVRAAASPGEVTAVELAGDQLALLEVWDGAADVCVVDAVCSGGKPGTVYRFDAQAALAGTFRRRGTHLFCLADVIELGRALGRLPPRLTGFGIEGAGFAIGAGLSPQVAAAVDEVASLLLAGIRAGA